MTEQLNGCFFEINVTAEPQFSLGRNFSNLKSLIKNIHGWPNFDFEYPTEGAVVLCFFIIC